jgi:hypothetical protein
MPILLWQSKNQLDIFVAVDMDIDDDLVALCLGYYCCVYTLMMYFVLCRTYDAFCIVPLEALLSSLCLSPFKSKRQTFNNIYAYFFSSMCYVMFID